MGFDPVSFAIGKASGGGGGGGGKLQKKTFTVTEIQSMLQGAYPLVVGPDAGYDGLSSIEVTLPNSWDVIKNSTETVQRVQAQSNKEIKTFKGGETPQSYIWGFYSDASEESGYDVSASDGSTITMMLNGWIPAGYSKLLVDAEVSGRTYEYNYASLFLVDAYGVKRYNEGNFVGNALKRVVLTSYLQSETVETINNQEGVTIHTDNKYVLSRQTVQVDISGITVPFWIGWSRCDNSATIHSIIASK